MSCGPPGRDEGPASLAWAFTVDSIAPESPLVTTPADGDTLFDTRQPDITGTAESGSTVRLELDGTELATLEASEAGDWRFRPDHELALGEHTLRVTATDQAGNTSPPAMASFTLANRKSYYSPGCAAGSTPPAFWALLLLVFCLRRSA